MIQTKVPGSPAAVDSAAEFLGRTLKSALDDAGDDVKTAAENAWHGVESIF